MLAQERLPHGPSRTLTSEGRLDLDDGRSNPVASDAAGGGMGGAGSHTSARQVGAGARNSALMLESRPWQHLGIGMEVQPARADEHEGEDVDAIE